LWLAGVGVAGRGRMGVTEYSEGSESS